MKRFTYITDYIGSNITKIYNFTGQITCNVIKISNIIYYVTDYNESSSIWFVMDRKKAAPSVQTVYAIPKASLLLREISAHTLRQQAVQTDLVQVGACWWC